MVSGLLAKSASRIPMPWMRALSGVRLVVPYYHMVSDRHVPHVSHLYSFRGVAAFTADAEYLARHFQPVTLSDIVAALNGGAPLPRACVHLTFDDGFREMHEVVAPILRRVGLPATFFLNTAFLDRGGLAHHNVISLILDAVASDPVRASAAETWAQANLPAPSQPAALRQRLLSIRYAQHAQVRALADHLHIDIGGYVAEAQPYLSSDQVKSLLNQGFSIGAHSHDHPHYADLSLADQLAQTCTSMEFLETRFAIQPKSFAFPHNDVGVGPEFFARVFDEKLLDVSFGTAGLVPHFHPRNIERFTMEKTDAPAAQILAHQFARSAYQKFRPRS
ncbi:MAG TPA: polysaccharide deacetylase family protein [Terracidiphilus sp.]|nr:polysaccharide deacetylase family protein [Terracidiphilus sp.]